MTLATLRREAGQVRAATIPGEAGSLAKVVWPMDALVNAYESV